MRPRLLYLFFFITGGLAQETSLPTSADNILLDVKNLPSAKENQVPKKTRDDNTANIDEILKELSIERNRNKDLNETISDILERMAAMEKNIIRNEEKITDNKSSVVLLTKDLEDLTEAKIFNICLSPVNFASCRIYYCEKYTIIIIIIISF